MNLPQQKDQVERAVDPEKQEWNGRNGNHGTEHGTDYWGNKCAFWDRKKQYEELAGYETPEKGALLPI